MPLTFSQMQTKFQRLSRSSNADVLTQASEDMNLGYSRFTAKFARYFSRKQQFTSLVANQGIYQTPIDSVRVLTMTVLVTSTYEVPLKEVRSESEWRWLTSYKTLASNWPEFYMVLGDDEISIWPLPSQSVTNGLRYVYQPTDHDLSVADVTDITSGQTVTVTNGSETVTATGSPFNSGMGTLFFRPEGITDITWYEIFNATTTTLTLKTPFAGTSNSGLAFRVGQLCMLPAQYSDVPIDFALWRYWSAQGNGARGNMHKQYFEEAITDAVAEYSSSNESSAIVGSGLDNAFNIWVAPPPAS